MPPIGSGEISDDTRIFAELGFGVGLDIGSSEINLAMEVLWFLNSFGLTDPASTPTYTGPTAHWVADSTGTLINQGGLVNSLGQKIPPVRGGVIATTVAGGALLGSELVTNGTFPNTSGWSVTAGNGTIAAVSGELEATSGSSGVLVSSPPVTTVIGRRYQFAGTGRRGTYAGSPQYGMGESNSLTPTQCTFSTTSNTTVSGYYTATTTTSYVLFRFPSIAEGTTAYLDNVSVKEVLPTLLSSPAGSAVVLAQAFTNKVTARKRNPVDTTNVTASGDAAAVLSVVDDVAALAAAGLSTICNTGKVYKLDNSAGVATAYATIGVAGNANPHYLTCYIRTAGTITGNSLISSYTPYTGVSIAAGGGYTKAAVAGVQHVDNTMQLRASPGATVYFILPSLTETTAAPPFPVVDGADGLNTVSTAATDWQYPIASIPPLALANGWQVRGKLTVKALPTTDQVLFSDPTSGAMVYVRGSDAKLVYRGASLGAELNGDVGFDNAGYWSVSETNPNSDVTFSSGVATFVSDGTYLDIAKSGIVTVGKRYRAEVVCPARTSGALLVNIGSVEGTTIINNTGTFTQDITATIDTTIRIKRQGACNLAVTSFSVKEVKEIATAALVLGSTYEWGVRQTPQGASISLAGTVVTDATMTTMPTLGANLEIGHTGTATLYLSGELPVDSSSKFIVIRDSSDVNWFSSTSF